MERSNKPRSILLEKYFGNVLTILSVEKYEIVCRVSLLQTRWYVFKYQNYFHISIRSSKFYFLNEKFFDRETLAFATMIQTRYCEYSEEHYRVRKYYEWRDKLANVFRDDTAFISFFESVSKKTHLRAIENIWKYK